MLKTISECNRELEKIDSDMVRLELEKKHVLEIRELLKEQSFTRKEPEERKLRADRGFEHLRSEKQCLINIITDNPGIDGRRIFGICSTFFGLTDTRKITFWLSDLRRQDYIENQGKRGLGARWYIKETHD